MRIEYICHSRQTGRQALQFAVSLKFRQCTVNYFCSAHVTKAQAHRDKHTHTHARRWKIEHAAESISSSLVSLCFCLDCICLYIVCCCCACDMQLVVFFSFIAKLQAFDDCAQTARLLRDSNRRAESTTARKRCSYKTNSKLSHWRTL